MSKNERRTSNMLAELLQRVAASQVRVGDEYSKQGNVKCANEAFALSREVQAVVDELTSQDLANARMISDALSGFLTEQGSFHLNDDERVAEIDSDAYGDDNRTYTFVVLDGVRFRVTVAVEREDENDTEGDNR